MTPGTQLHGPDWRLLRPPPSLLHWSSFYSNLSDDFKPAPRPNEKKDGGVQICLEKYDRKQSTNFETHIFDQFLSIVFRNIKFPSLFLFQQKNFCFYALFSA